MKQTNANTIFSALFAFILLVSFDLSAKPEFVDNSKPAHTSQSGNVAGPIEQLLEGLRARLEKQPDDVKGWVLLAKSYNHLGRTQKAEHAAAQARALGFKGDILGTSKAAASPRKMPNDRNHRGVTDDNAGAYVSSFFENLETEPSKPSAVPAEKKQ